MRRCASFSFPLCEGESSPPRFRARMFRADNRCRISKVTLRDRFAGGCLRDISAFSECASLKSG